MHVYEKCTSIIYSHNVLDVIHTLAQLVWAQIFCPNPTPMQTFFLVKIANKASF
jgi:hypothetical protein